MFRTNRPVTDAAFFDRAEELGRLRRLVAALGDGRAEWVAIIGPRKVGKTSLVLELERVVHPDREVAIVVIDAENERPLSWELFRTYALRAADALLGTLVPSSFEIAATRPDEYAEQLLDADAVRALPRDVASVLRALPTAPMDARFVRQCLDLPQKLAEALDRKVVVAFDEFQELATDWSQRQGDPLPVIRSAWQNHTRVAYIVSGSGRTMLEEMVSAQHSPFFQHFSLMYLDRFERREAIAMLRGAAPDARPIPEAVASAAFEAIGGHPFYLQLLGEEITRREPPYDDRTIKESLQEVLFSRAGRLGLYFQNTFDRLVGNSSYLAATLDTLSASPRRLTEVASELGVKSGDAVRYLERLGDAVRKTEDGRYALEDPTFGLWLAWRRPGGSVVPMSMVGDAAEKEVAALLARIGFDLVYQSRASRGAFDLLATRGSLQLGIQVKRSPLPLSFDKPAFHRMKEEARRFGWSWLVAAAPADGPVVFLDPAKARAGKTMRLGDDAAIDNVLAWLEAPVG